MRERPTPNGPHPGRRRHPWAASCRPHSAQSQLARARAVGLVTGPHARIPRHPQPAGSGALQPAQRAGSRGWESARPRTPHTQARGGPSAWPATKGAVQCKKRQEAAPPGTLMPPPQHARARAVQSVTGPHARIPPHPQPVGSGPRQPAQRAGSRGWESALPRTPHIQVGGAPRGRPRAAPTARKASSQEHALWGW